MNNLFLLDPTPKALCGFSQAARRDVYRQIGEMFRAKLSQPPGGRVTLSTISADHHSTFDVVFGQMADKLVVLAIGQAVSAAKLRQFESIMETLAHVDLSSVGLIVSELPDATEHGARVLDGAINLYCHRHVQRRSFHRHEHDSSVDSFIHRLTSSPVRRWASSEARTKFKDVLDRAERDPQVIERGERRFVLVDESQLETLAGQKNAVEMYKHFFEDLEPMEPFERITGRAPGRLLDLS